MKYNMYMHKINRAFAAQAPQTRIVILGGGFGGVTTARRLERLCKGRTDVEIILVSRDNFLLMTPLLFEVCSGASMPAGRRAERPAPHHRTSSHNRHEQLKTRNEQRILAVSRIQVALTIMSITWSG